MAAPAADPRIARLRHAVSQQVQGRTEPSRVAISADSDALRALLRIETRDTPAGPVFIRDDWYALDHAHGSMPLAAALDADPEALAHLLGADDAPHPSRMAYFDIETTGLSSGAGTYVVLAGLGSFEPDGYRLRQYFLADIAHERAMLAMLAADMARFEGIVTYNGRAFDVPCMEARLALSRVASPCPPLAHADLLFAVRRLYRHRMPGCRLSDAERRLLRIERSDDVPGSLIPSIYFDYARTGRMGPLRGVFRHNAEDVLSLAGILAGIAGLLSGGDPSPEDAVALARWWERVGRSERAMHLYREALPWLVGEDDWSWAAARHARLCRSAGLRDEAASIWTALWDAGDATAGLDLAKHYEHRVHDFAAAESIVETLLASESGTGVADLERRVARIRRKAERRSPS